MTYNTDLISKKARKRLDLIETKVYRRRQVLAPFQYLGLPDPLAPPPIPACDGCGGDEAWQEIPWGGHWGSPHTGFALWSAFQLPSQWNADVPTALYLPIGQAGDFSHPEALITIDGHEYAACDRHHQEVLLPIEALDGQEHSLLLHGWCGSLRNDPDARLLMRECALVQIDQWIRDFIALARVSLGVADHLADDNPAKPCLYIALDEAFKVLDTRHPLGSAFYESVSSAHQMLAQAVARCGTPLDVHITAIGHAHIDVAWLWTLGQTRRKCGRTFHNVLRLMDQSPQFRFSQSQPQLYDFVRQDYPELFARITDRVDEQRWEPLGGMWVEADCNISGGESLVRQFLLGRRFFEDHFGAGAESPVLWLPDVFGYAWNLPQLIRQAGLEYFFTIKLGWNEVNRIPYDSFWWQGLDGTRVLTHFSTTPVTGSPHASTYNAEASPHQVLGTWRNFQQKDVGLPGAAPPLLMSYGFGDGGGGPTRKMVENIGLMQEFPSTPQVQFGSVHEFFDQLSLIGDRLPVWNGELYLEHHRGTYTTQGRNKRANRKSEFLLHDAEFLAALASEMSPDYRYPHTELRRAWELVCLNQFHDIIPGSSIGPVYVESLEQYSEVAEIGGRIREQALESIADSVGADLLLVNPTSFVCSDLALCTAAQSGDRELVLPSGAPTLCQRTSEGLLIDAGAIPPYSVLPLRKGSAASMTTNDDSALRATPQSVENSLLQVELNEDGDIIRIRDKWNEREVLPPEAIANQFQLFEDRPLTPDAWDIDVFYDDRMWLAEPAQSVRVVESGPLRATLEVRRKLMRSECVQYITLTRDSARLDFRTSVQWRERHSLLKVAFPVDVLSPEATYEVQFGNVKRPTHRNTSWDWARFETCAQKWVDLSEGGYGVSLLNDCKYGHDIRDNVIRLTLLRGTTEPDPEADLGEHLFAYSLLPHAGPWDQTTIAAAYALNDPLIMWQRPEGAVRSERIQAGRRQRREIASLISVDQPNVVVETVKRAEDGRGIIVRLYESQRSRCKCTITHAGPLLAAWRCTILERDDQELEVRGRSVQFEIKPYQIVTLRLLTASSAEQ